MIKFIKDIHKTDFPLPFINSVTKDFFNQQETVQQNNEEELIIRSYFFEVKPSFLPYCEKYEAKSKDFVRKFHKFTNKQFWLASSWNTKKLSFLSRVKDKTSTQDAKYTMVNVNLLKIILKKPLERLQRVGQNKTAQHINDKQYNIWKNKLYIWLVHIMQCPIS